MALGGLYLDRGNGKLLGVCAGIADRLDIDVIWVRIAALVLLLSSAGVAVFLYFLAAFLAAPAPPRQLQKRGRPSALAAHRLTPYAVKDLGVTLRQLEKRLEKVEAHYTDPARNLAREIDSLEDPGKDL